MKLIQTLSTQSIQLQNTYTLPSIPHYLLQTVAPLPPFFPFHPKEETWKHKWCAIYRTHMCELNLTCFNNSAQRSYTYWHNLLIVKDTPFGGSLSPTNTPTKENKLCPNTTQQRGGQPTTRTGDNCLFAKIPNQMYIPYRFHSCTLTVSKSHAIKHNLENKWSGK